MASPMTAPTATKSTNFVATPVSRSTWNNVPVLTPYSAPSGAKARAMRNPENPGSRVGSLTPVDPIREAKPVSRSKVYKLLKLECVGFGLANGVERSVWGAGHAHDV